MKTIKGLEKVMERLRGRCSKNDNTCPKTTVDDWKCADCVAMFAGIVDLEDAKVALNKENGLHPGYYVDHSKPCPCVVAPEVAIVRLKEYVEELKVKFSLVRKDGFPTRYGYLCGHGCRYNIGNDRLRIKEDNSHTYIGVCGSIAGESIWKQFFHSEYGAAWKSIRAAERFYRRKLKERKCHDKHNTKTVRE